MIGPNHGLRVAAVGLGQWGRNVARNIHGLQALHIAYDVSLPAREAFAASYPDVALARTLDQIWNDASINAVMIATPAATHGILAAEALRAGKHVFVEKPLCLDLAEARELKMEATRRKRVLMVGHLLHYHPAFISLQEVVRSGSLGQLRYIYSHRLSLGRFRREENALWSFAPHDISMILALTGTMPIRIVAEGGHFLSQGIADTTLSHFTFRGGQQAHVFVSWLHPYKDQRLVVVGEKAMAVFNDVAAGPQKLLLYRHRAAWDGDIPLVSKAEAEPLRYDPAEPLHRECEAFLGAIRGGPMPPSDAAEAIRVLTVLDACQRALDRRSPVELSSEC